MSQDLDRARAAVAAARAVLVTAGAGMGVDSGLPDFRGDEGFWNAYPPFRRLGLGFVDLANPEWFTSDPALAWGFYGHRLELYRRTVPHAGFARLRAWFDRVPGFVFTSNVDLQFQAAGFAEDRIVECHGTLAMLQCHSACGQRPWSSAGVRVDVDPDTFRAREPLPVCPTCGWIARPNVLMFGDAAWDPARTAAQEARFRVWLGSVDLPGLVVVECGAGTAIPTVRRLGETLAARGATLIRVNPREAVVPKGQIAIRTGARHGIESLLP